MAFPIQEGYKWVKRVFFKLRMINSLNMLKNAGWHRYMD